MRNFMYITITSGLIILAMIINTVRLHRQVELLNDAIQTTYIEVQELRYKISQLDLEKDEVFLNNNSNNTCLLNNK